MWVEPTFTPLCFKLAPLICTSPFKVIAPVRVMLSALPVMLLSVTKTELVPT